MNPTLIKGDITTVQSEAIVNAANSSLLGGGGVDGAIHRKGGNAILEACLQIRNEQGGCKVGQAVITTAGNLPATYVIHTVGPIWDGGHSQESEFLRNCYVNSLKLAEKYGIKSIAFPNISTGVYRFPKALAASIACEAVTSYLSDTGSQIKVLFVCYDHRNYEIYQSLLGQVG